MSGSGPPSPMHTEFSPNQASVWTSFGLDPIANYHPQSLASGTSSLSSALDEDLSRPWRNGTTVSPPFCGRLSPPSPGYIRISHTCRVAPTHDVIHFRWKSQLGIPLDSLLAGTRQIDHCDTLLNSPTGTTSLMHISVGRLVFVLLSFHLTSSSVGRIPSSAVLCCREREIASFHDSSPWEKHRG
jgi:hypothetical protein